MTAIASELVVEIADFGIAVAVCAAFAVMRAQFAPGAIRDCGTNQTRMDLCLGWRLRTREQRLWRRRNLRPCRSLYQSLSPVPSDRHIRARHPGRKQDAISIRGVSRRRQGFGIFRSSQVGSDCCIRATQARRVISRATLFLNSAVRMRVISQARPIESSRYGPPINLGRPCECRYHC